MDNILDLTIVSPNGIIFSGKVKRVKVPGANGDFTIYSRHAALISSLMKGKIVCYEDNMSKEIEIKSGFIEVLHDSVSICIEQ